MKALDLIQEQSSDVCRGGSFRRTNVIQFDGQPLHRRIKTGITFARRVISKYDGGERLRRGECFSTGDSNQTSEIAALNTTCQDKNRFDALPDRALEACNSP